MLKEKNVNLRRLRLGEEKKKEERRRIKKKETTEQKYSLMVCPIP